MKIINSEYLTSAVKKEQFLNDKPQVAFVGRSNVGKSSLINALCGKKSLAKTSSTLGLTKMVNYFLINKEFYLVDLPGYGYSKTGKFNAEKWDRLMDDYFTDNPSLKIVFLLADIRHDPTELDKQMLKYLFLKQIPCQVVATKSDKFAKSKVKQELGKIAKGFGIGIDNIVDFSAINPAKKENILQLIENML